MSKAALHPAQPLSESHRIEYYRAVAGVAVADKKIAPAERHKLRRLAEVLGLSGVFADAQLDALSLGNSSGRDALIQLIGKDDALRESLMTDSLVVAFVDGKLDAGESRQLTALALALGFSTAEVLKIAAFVEKVLFQRDPAHSDHHALAEEFGDVLRSGGSTGWYGWLRHLAG